MQPIARALVLVAVGGVYMAAVAFAVSIAASWREEAAAAERARGASRLRNHRRSFGAPDRRFTAPDRRFSAPDRRFSAPDRRSRVSGRIVPGYRSRSGARTGTGGSFSGSGSSARALTGEDEYLDDAVEDVAAVSAEPAGVDAASESGADSRSPELSDAVTPWDGGRLALDEELSAEEFVRRVRETLAASETSDASASEARETFAATYAAREDLPDIVQQIEGRLGFVHPALKEDAATLRGELCGRG
jgi:hypothetical protein